STTTSCCLSFSFARWVRTVMFMAPRGKKTRALDDGGGANPVPTRAGKTVRRTGSSLDIVGKTSNLTASEDVGALVCRTCPGADGRSPPLAYTVRRSAVMVVAKETSRDLDAT